MPRNANTGVYTPPANSWNPATPDTVISSADWNALRDDMATALNHAPSTTRALHPTTGQVQDGAFVWGGTAGGTADALTLTLTPPITAYVPGLTIRFRTGPAANATATPTLSVNGLAAHTITRYDGMPLIAGDLPADAMVGVIHDGSAWRLLLTVKSQVQSNDGATTVTSATSITLTNASTRVQVVSITTDRQSVFLPDAKTLTVGGPRYYVRNAGSKTFALRPSNANQVVNGGFDNSAAWVLGTGWSISGGVATKTSGSAADIEQVLSTTDGVAYLVTFTITSISGGSVRAVLKGGGPEVLGPPRSAPGTYTETLSSTGNTTLALRADASFAGSIDDVSLVLKHPPLLVGMPPGSVAECVLEDNNTIQGKWHIIGRDTVAAVTVVNATLPSSLTQASEGVRNLKLSETVSLHFAQNSSGHPFVFAVDHDSVPPVIGTPVLIFAANYFVIQAFRLSDSKAFIVTSPAVGNAGVCFIVSVSGITCSVSSYVTANAFNITTHSGAPLTAVLGSNKDLFVALGGQIGGLIQAQAVDASGNVPVAGGPVNISSLGIPGTYGAISIFRVNDNRAVAFYIDDSGTSGSPYSIRAAVLTLTGTSIDIGTSAGINDVVNNGRFGHGVICQVSNTSYVWVYGSGTNVQAVAITVSGTSVTFGTPITVTTFDTNDIQVYFGLGTRFNPIVFALSGNRVFVAFRRYILNMGISEFRCAILTVSGSSVSVGELFSLNFQLNPVFINHSDEHTVLVQRRLTMNRSTGSVVGLNHPDTSITVIGSVTPMGVPDFWSDDTLRLSNGLICVRYTTTGDSAANAPQFAAKLFSSRVEVLAPSPTGAPKSLGHFTIPEILWNNFTWPVEVSPRRIAFLDDAALQEGASKRLKLCIMEVVSWPH